MQEIRFEWDARKAAENLRKHGVTFPEAETVFEDESALLLPDPDHSHDEERFVVLQSIPTFSAACRSYTSPVVMRRPPAARD